MKKEGKTLKKLESLGIISNNASLKIKIEIEKRLKKSIEESKKIIHMNKKILSNNDINYFDLFKIYSERKSVLSLAIPL